MLFNNKYISVVYLAFLMLFISFEVSAQQADKQDSFLPEIYSIYNIAVDETAKNVDRARSSAIKKGQKEAFGKLLRKIIRTEDVSKLPPADANLMLEVVSGFEVQNEKRSSVRYLADMTVHFNPERVQQFLAEYDIAYAETLSTPQIILPIVIYNGTIQLWDQDNPWWAAWARHHSLNNLVRTFLPARTLDNRMQFSALQFRDSNPENILDLAGQYDQDSIMVVIATVMKNFETNSYDVTLDTRLTAVNSETLTGRINHTAPELDMTIDESLDGAVEAAAYWLDNQWKQKVLVQFGVTSELNIKAVFENPQEWRTYQNVLSKAPLIKNMSLQKLQVSEAHLNVRHAGEVEQLILALSQEGLTLEQQDEQWTLLSTPEETP